MEGTKNDTDKVRLDLLPPSALLLIGEVLTYGARKYGDNNWRQVEKGQSRYLAATLRHLMAHMSGHPIDEESELSHLAHAATSLLMMIEHIYVPRGKS